MISEYDSEKPEHENMPASPVYMQKLCRSCLSEIHKDYFWLEGYYLEKKIIDIYKNVTSIEVDATDFLPRKLCISCYDHIIKFDLFKNKVLESEKKLAEIAVSVCTELLENKEEMKTENSEFEEKTENEFWYDIHDNQDTYSEDLSVSETLEKITESVQKSDPENETSQTKTEVNEINSTENDSEYMVGTLQIVPKAKIRKRTAKKKLKDKLRDDCLERKCGRKKEPCKECGKELFTNKMANHIRTHTKEKPFECETCDARFSEKSNLTRHTKTHGNDRPFKCTICEKAFLRPSSKAMHELTAHVSEKNILCPTCGKAFKHQYFLTKHMANIHNNSETKVKIEGAGYQCPVCGNLYRTKSSLTVHKMKHEQPKAFLCNICGNAFSTKAVLENHQKVHTGEKNYSCDICNKKFRCFSTLKTHILVHSGEKPLSCHICDKQFRQHSHLNTHIRGQHSTNRPYQCSFCTKTFKQSCNLTVHTRIHTGETPYHCDVCQKGFYDSSSMKKHNKRSHFGKTIVDYVLNRIEDTNTLQT